MKTKSLKGELGDKSRCLAAQAAATSGRLADH